MSISIVINNYNYGRYLGEAIRSALEQSVPALEVIVVDDGSTDDSRGVIESFGGRIRKIYQENGGQAAAFNTGFAAATGDWVWLLDADDTLKPDAVETGLRLAERGVSRIAMSVDLVDAAGGRIGAMTAGSGKSRMAPLDEIILEHGGLPAIPTSGNLFSREALVGIFPVPVERFRICADAYLFVRCGETGETKLDPHPVANYRVHGGNHFYHDPADVTDQAVLKKQLKNILTTRDLLDDYAATLAAWRGRQIRRYWHGDQVLLTVLRCKMAGLRDPEIERWGWFRLMAAFASNLVTGPHRFRVRVAKTRQALKIVLNGRRG